MMELMCGWVGVCAKEELVGHTAPPDKDYSPIKRENQLFENDFVCSMCGSGL